MYASALATTNLAFGKKHYKKKKKFHFVIPLPVEVHGTHQPWSPGQTGSASSPVQGRGRDSMTPLHGVDYHVSK